MSGRAQGWRNCGIYMWRTRKPHAVLGLPLRVLLVAAVVTCWAGWITGTPAWWLAALMPLLSGRHTAYVGETASRYFRDRQHLHGSYRFGSAAKPWSDLDPKVYPLPCLFPANEVARKVQEKLYIWILLPVYNVEWNTKNPRRISPGKAEQQRWARDANGLRKWAPRTLRLAVYGLVLIGGIYSGWERWL